MNSALNRNLKLEVPNKERDIHSLATSGQVTGSRTIITNDEDMKMKFRFSLQKFIVKLLLSLYNELTYLFHGAESFLRS